MKILWINLIIVSLVWMGCGLLTYFLLRLTENKELHFWISGLSPSFFMGIGLISVILFPIIKL